MFLDRLRELTDYVKGNYARGAEMPPAHANLQFTFGGMLDNLGYSHRQIAKANFNDEVMRLPDLFSAMKASLGAPGMSNAELAQAAVREGFMSPVAEQKNKLFRFGQGNKMEALVRGNMEALGLSGDSDVANYMRYLQSANVNINAFGEFSVSPNQQLTSAGLAKTSNAYDFMAGSVWDRSGKKNIVSFDIESSGFKLGPNRIAEVFASSVQLGEDTGFTSGFSMRAKFNVAEMGYGAYRGADGTAMPLSAKFGATKAASGDEFVRQVRPILATMASENTTNILGQNIMGFDIERLVGNVMRTSAYQEDAELMKLTNEVARRIGEEEGFVIDTLRMLPEYEKNMGKQLGMSKYLTKNATPRSIQNILLSTNLIDIMKEDGTWAEVSGRHHTGKFDTMVTSAFYEAMVSMRLEFAPSNLSNAEIKAILSSKASVLTSKIVDAGDVLPDVADHMMRLDPDYKFGAFDIDAPNKHIDARSVPTPTGGGGFLDLVNASDRLVLDTDLTYLDQASIHTRRLDVGRSVYDTTDDVISIAESIDRFTEPLSLENIGDYQRSLGKLPFSGLGLPERVLTDAVVRASMADEAVQGVKGLADSVNILREMGVSYFGGNANADIGVLGARGRKVKMSLGQVRQMTSEVGDIFDMGQGGVDTARLNIARAGERTYANLELGIRGDRIDDVALAKIERFIRRTNLDVDEDTLEEILDVFRGSMGDGAPPGFVNIGSLSGASAEDLADAMEDFAEDVRDTTEMRVSILDDMADVEDADLVRVGPVSINRNQSVGELNAVARDAERANALSEQSRRAHRSKRFRMAARVRESQDRVADTGKVTVGDQIPPNYGVEQYKQFKRSITDAIDKGYRQAAETIAKTRLFKSADTAETFLKKGTLPMIAVGALTAFVARKNNKDGPYDDTFASEYGSGDYYNSQGAIQAYPLHSRVQSAVHPLSTAHLVFDSYDNRIGHTSVPGRVGV